MQIRDIGLSVLKGGRHTTRENVLLEVHGPAGDRLFAVVDLADGRVLKTVEHPLLLTCRARWDDGVLSVGLGGRQVAATPELNGQNLTLDYWGRAVCMHVVGGPWARAFSRLLGKDVALAQINAPGGLVYGDSITIVTTSSLRRLADEAAATVDARQFRATFTIDTGDAAAHVEDSWAGREMDLGRARLLVGAGIPRCAVIDLEPDTGASGTNLLKTLARYRLSGSDIPFGVYAQVIRPGIVGCGDQVRVLPES
ncbi:MOSC domain-containing protein [Cryobacterium sp. TMS1-13-1]|uniref:MOSC domain-containing protein n=1 Tax=Cryobacterium sp. TMS1-13-1 TaxID=1259220 RepID=UPI00106AA9DB|nr:MOSC domain-containing protein [Cryobacterium sp. TMS1-13-1]TFD23386.1 MOSC domain-containing protein [Cryobacterium sp. TMS1-13-1]